MNQIKEIGKEINGENKNIKRMQKIPRKEDMFVWLVGWFLNALVSN